AQGLTGGPLAAGVALGTPLVVPPDKPYLPIPIPVGGTLGAGTATIPLPRRPWREDPDYQKCMQDLRNEQLSPGDQDGNGGDGVIASFGDSHPASNVTIRPRPTTSTGDLGGESSTAGAQGPTLPVGTHNIGDLVGGH